jgi:high-affinity iron transporter
VRRSGLASSQTVGALAGLAVAVAAGYLIYRGSRRINLRAFFRVTGMLVLLFAAGLLAKGIHEFQDAALLGTLNEHVWDLRGLGWLDPDTSRFAEFLKGLFGWNPAPSFEMVVAYLAYAAPVALTFLSESRALPSVAPAPAPESARANH